MVWAGTTASTTERGPRRSHERRSHPQPGTRVIQSHRVCGDQVHRDRNHRPCHPGLPSLVHRPEVQLSSTVDASENGPFEPPPNRVDRDQTLLEELVWSIALIGGVVAYLVLVVQFA